MIEYHFLGSEKDRQRIIDMIKSAPINGATKVTINDSKGKSARCRGLQWIWNKEVAKSGIGRWDDPNDVHREGKYRWAIPILIRDNDVFSEVWPELEKRFREEPEKMRYLVDHFVSTEGEGFAIGEYLEAFEKYWRGAGVDLLVPGPGLWDHKY